METFFSTILRDFFCFWLLIWYFVYLILKCFLTIILRFFLIFYPKLVAQLALLLKLLLIFLCCPNLFYLLPFLICPNSKFLVLLHLDVFNGDQQQAFSLLKYLLTLSKFFHSQFWCLIISLKNNIQDINSTYPTLWFLLL